MGLWLRMMTIIVTYNVKISHSKSNIRNRQSMVRSRVLRVLASHGFFCSFHLHFISLRQGLLLETMKPKPCTPHPQNQKTEESRAQTSWNALVLLLLFWAHLFVLGREVRCFFLQSVLAPFRVFMVWNAPKLLKPPKYIHVYVSQANTFDAFSFYVLVVANNYLGVLKFVHWIRVVPKKHVLFASLLDITIVSCVLVN